MTNKGRSGAKVRRVRRVGPKSGMSATRGRAEKLTRIKVRTLRPSGARRGIDYQAALRTLRPGVAAQLDRDREVARSPLLPWAMPGIAAKNNPGGIPSPVSEGTTR